MYDILKNKEKYKTPSGLWNAQEISLKTMGLPGTSKSAILPLLVTAYLEGISSAPFLQGTIYKHLKHILVLILTTTSGDRNYVGFKDEESKVKRILPGFQVYLSRIWKCEVQVVPVADESQAPVPSHSDPQTLVFCR